MFNQFARDNRIGVVKRIGSMKQLEVIWTDGPVMNERIKFDDVTPVFVAVKDDRNTFPHLASLDKRQDFKELIERAEAAREQHDRLCKIDEPEFSHEEVVEMDMQFTADIGIVEFLLGDRDRQADVMALGFRRAAISGLHDAWPAAGANNKAPLLIGQPL